MEHFIVVSSAQQSFINQQVCPVLQTQPQLLAQNITIPITIQNEDRGVTETTQLLTIPPMDGGSQLSVIPNNIVPVQQYQSGQTILLTSALPSYPLAQVSTSKIVFTAESLGFDKDNYTVTTTGDRTDISAKGSKGFASLLNIHTPGGEEKKIYFSDHLDKLNIPSILHKVCRSIGIDEEMEGHLECLPVEMWKQCQKHMHDLEKECEEEESQNIGANDKSPQKPNDTNGFVICHFCNFKSKDAKKCQQCKRTLGKLKTKLAQQVLPNYKLVLVETVGIGERENLETKKKRSPRKKPPDEPVCLTISSDEEEEDETTESIPTNGHSEEVNTIDAPINNKEPVITETTESPTNSKIRVEGGGLDMAELLDSPDLEKALLQCRTVRIGSYKVVPEEKVTLSEFGIKFKIPSLNNDQVTIKILRTDIIKVLVHFGQQLPVLFFYLTNGAGIKVRNALKMSHKPESIYFDPTSNVDMHRRITLLPDKIPFDTRLFIKDVYDRLFLLDELSAKEADEILVRTTVPKEISAPPITPKKDNFSSQTVAPAPVVQKLQIIMVYPPAPAKAGISINTEDYACLGEDQFLNDVIIDFYLKWFFLTKLSPEIQKKTHIFSSFFYKRLTTKVAGGLNKFQDDPKLTPAEKRHSRVRSWTKTVDLFSKEFIIIPINENSHWFLAIICFPGLSQTVKMKDNTSVVISPKKNNRRQIPTMSSAVTITMVKKEIPIELEPDDEEKDEADADDDDLEPNTSDDETIKDENMEEADLMDEATPKLTRSAKIDTEDPIKQPCILIFDSLVGASRSRVCATLREYLQVEYSLKHKGSPRDFSKDTIRGAVPKVPQQTNYTDCGLYVLQYVEAFFDKPITNFKMPIKMLKEWFPTDIVSRKRYEIQQLLHQLMQEQNINISRINLPELNLHPDGTDALVDYFEDAEEEEIAEIEHDIEIEEEMEEEEVEEEEHFEEEEEVSDVFIKPTAINKASTAKIESIKPSLSNLGEITISSSKRKITPVTLKEIRNPRLTGQQAVECKKIRKD